jgi:hypothetical protein
MHIHGLFRIFYFPHVEVEKSVGFILLEKKRKKIVPCWCGLVVSSPPATEETGAMVREIESRRGIQTLGCSLKNENWKKH